MSSKDLGREAITDRASKFEAKGPYKDINYLKTGRFYEPRIEDDAQLDSFLEQIWKVYGHLSGTQLANISHTDGGAWRVLIRPQTVSMASIFLTIL